MQIACRPTGNSTIPERSEYRVGVAGNQYDMYAISHLSYGLMQVVTSANTVLPRPVSRRIYVMEFKSHRGLLVCTA